MTESRKINGPRNRGFASPGTKISKETIKRLFSYFKKYKIKLVIVIICILISSVVQVIGQLFLQKLIDDYITPLIGQTIPTYTPLIKFLCVLGGIYLFGVICAYTYNRVMVKVAQGILKDVRDQMFNHMQYLPISYFDKNSHGDIMSRYTNDTDTLRQMISQSLPSLFSSLISIIFVFISMLVLNIPLTILVIVGIFLMFTISGKIAKKSGEYFVKQQTSLGKVNGFVEEMIEGQKVIKVFTHEEITKQEFDKLNEELFESSTIASASANIMGPISNNIGNIIYVIIAFIGGIIAIKTSNFTLGAIASFLTLTKSFTNPIMQITSQISSVIMALAGSERIFNLLDEQQEENKGTVKLVNVKKEKNKIIETKEQTNIWAWKKDNELIELKGDIRFNNVHFGYKKEKEVLHDICMYAKPGQKIALVGATGAGKTTITNLLNRFYDIDSGTIIYDGININEINKSDLRKSLGMVLQDTNLFTGTIMDNIRYGNSEATDEECINAAKLANADEFIRLLPEGYNTHITANGSNLSQGQRQLISIARCAIANAPAMILDEATSSIDTRTEKIIADGMDNLMKNRTVFVIAHRLSTVQNAKAIMVMEKGNIIERGSHDELIDLKGKYYSLYTGKFELE